MTKKLVFLIVILGIITTVFFYTTGSNLFGLSSKLNQTQTTIPSYDNYPEIAYEEESSPSQADLPSIADNLRNLIGGKTGISMPQRILPPYPTVIQDQALDVDERVYERSSNFSLVVSNVSQYVYDISSYFLSNGARILSSSINTTDKYQHAYLYARVPADIFDEVNLKIKTNIKKVYSENISSKDDTADLVTAKSEIDRLTEEKMNKEEEILTTYDEIEKQRLEKEIIRLQNQLRLEQIKLKSLESKTQWAAIKITVANSEKYFKPYDPNETDLTEVFENSLNTVIEIGTKGLVLLIQVAVFSLIWFPPLLLIKVLFFRSKKKKSGKK